MEVRESQLVTDVVAAETPVVVQDNGQAAEQLSCALMLRNCQAYMQNLLSGAVQAGCWL